MGKTYQKLLPLPFRRFARIVYCVIRFFPQHILCGLNHLSLLLTKKKMLDLAVITMVKNEAPYLPEWIEYHRLLGVKKFYFYDNESNDNIKDVLQPYIDTGIVDYTYFPGKKVQVNAFNNAIKRFKNEAEYIAMIDIDEFIVPINNDAIIQVVNNVKNDCKARKKLFVGLVIKWVNYGYNGHYSKPDGLVTENYTKSDGISKCHKTIINPRLVIRYQTHDGIYLFNRYGVDENGKEVTGFVDPDKATVNSIRINHYCRKSYEEYKRKMSKGGAFSGRKAEFEIPLIDLLVLEAPLSYEVTWR